MTTQVTRTAPAISVIVAQDTYRPVLSCLEALVTQTLPPEKYELVLVDWTHGESSEARVARVRSRPHAPVIRYARCNNRGRAAINNLGVALSSAPLLCFCADDFVPSSSFVAAHLAHHEARPESTRIGIGGALATPEMRSASPFLAWLEDSNLLFGVRFHDPAVVVPRDFFYAANVSIKRELFERVGGFNERLPFPTHDDWELGLRLAEHDTVSEWIPEAMCVHDHIVSLVDRVEQMRQAGASAAMLERRGSAVDRQSTRRLARLVHYLLNMRHDGFVGLYWRLALASAYAAAYARELAAPSRAAPAMR